MSSKPDECAQKFLMTVEKDGSYVINSFPYFGNGDDRGNHECLGYWVVKKLLEPCINKSRNVACENFFTLLSLTDHLKSTTISIVDTVSRARREIPVFVKTGEE